MTRLRSPRNRTAPEGAPAEPLTESIGRDDTIQADAPPWAAGASLATGPTVLASATMRGVDGFAPSDELVTTETVGRYELQAEIGKGGIGRVWLALDRHLGRPIAIKELLGRSSTAGARSVSADGLTTRSPEELRFVNEARVTGQLEHPGIVPVYELGRRADGTIYYAMRLVRGRTLRAALGSGDLRERLALLPHFEDLCHAVAYAHSRGVVHRDLKPENVMLGDFGETVILDWGLAKARGQVDVQSPALEKALERLRDTSPVDTVAGLPIGTPSYMPPEQALGELDEIDERSDVYSLGAVLYELLTGHPPFDGRTALEIVRHVLRDEPTRPEQLEPDCPPELAAVAMRALEKDRERRYRDAAELAREVRAFSAGGLVHAHRYSVVELALRWVRAHRRLLGSVLLVLLAATASWLYRGHDLAKQQEQRRAAAEAQARQRVVDQAEELLGRARRGSGDPGWFDQYTLKLVSLGEPVSRSSLESRLVTGLTDESTDVRKLAARSLGGLASRDAVPALCGRLAPGAEREEAVLIEIINALGIIADPSSDRAVLEARGRAGERSRLWERTEASYRAIPLPELPPEGLDAEQWVARGLALADKGRPQEAADAFGRAIELAPLNPVAYGNRAVVREELGDSAGALEDYDQSLRLDPKQPEALNNRAALRSSREDYEGALGDYAAAMAAGGSSLAQLRNRATVRRFQADGAGALAELDAALGQAPDDPRTLAMKGYTLMWLGRFADALEPLDAAVRLEPSYGYALLRRALVRTELGEPAAALSDLDRALEEDPSDDYARRVRASLRLMLGDTAGARADVEACVSGRCERAGTREAWRLGARAVLYHVPLGSYAEALGDLDLALDLARRPEERVEMALLGLGVALELDDPRITAAWVERLVPQRGPPWHDDLVALVRGQLPAATLRPRATVPPRQCELGLATAVRAALDGEPALAGAAYDEAAASPWLEELPCQLARSLVFHAPRRRGRTRAP